jgi:phosphohistidine phosphatase SixA
MATVAMALRKQFKSLPMRSYDRAIYSLAAAAFTIIGLMAGARANDAVAWEALRQPGTVAMMRHAIAPGTGDPPDFRFNDCSTQRNLDENGRAQARAIGAAFRANGVEIDSVLTSQWCRCRETADLLDLAPVEDLPSLNSFFGDRSTRDAQTAATQRFLSAMPPYKRVVLVTHQVNMTALTGAYPASGEVFVLRIGNGGELSMIERILIRRE